MHKYFDFFFILHETHHGNKEKSKTVLAISSFIFVSVVPPAYNLYLHAKNVTVSLIHTINGLIQLQIMFSAAHKCIVYVVNDLETFNVSVRNRIATTTSRS